MLQRYNATNATVLPMLLKTTVDSTECYNNTTVYLFKLLPIFLVSSDHFVPIHYFRMGAIVACTEDSLHCHNEVLVIRSRENPQYQSRPPPPL